MQLVSAYRCWMHCLVYKKKKQGEEDLAVVVAVGVGLVEEVAGVVVSLIVEMIGLVVGEAAATTTDGETHTAFVIK